MRPGRFLGSCFITLLFTLCPGSPGPGSAYANPVYADEQSLSNGEQLYNQHCSECHGRIAGDYSGAQRVNDDLRPLSDQAAIIAIDPVEEPPPVPDDWPVWAERPNPNAVKVREPDVMEDVLKEVNAVIEKSYASGSEQPASKNAGVFNPNPGVTDLSDPATFYYGTSEEELFNSIADGTGAAMPGWRASLDNDEAIWDLVNYIRSFWSEEWLY
jgi:mono/diheme cytochrome c family protein